MREIFLEEAREVLANAREALAALHHEPADLEHLTGLRRAFHTLKGSARMVGLVEFGAAAWAGEQVFNTRLAEQRRPMPRCWRSPSRRSACSSPGSRRCPVAPVASPSRRRGAGRRRTPCRRRRSRSCPPGPETTTEPWRSPPRSRKRRRSPCPRSANCCRRICPGRGPRVRVPSDAQPPVASAERRLGLQATRVRGSSFARSMPNPTLRQPAASRRAGARVRHVRDDALSAGRAQAETAVPARPPTIGSRARPRFCALAPCSRPRLPRSPSRCRWAPGGRGEARRSPASRSRCSTST